MFKIQQSGVETTMLFSIKDLEGFEIQASDGKVGHVEDFYFDDDSWAIRYVVVNTGNWLNNKEVLISPIAIGPPNLEARSLPVSISMQQVKDCPDIDNDKPVSRQQEVDYLQYFGYQPYWGGVGLWGAGILPSKMVTDEKAFAKAKVDNNNHLRSFEAVKKYNIMASDGEIGHVQGLIVDEESWAIRYFVLNTSNWWLGNLVLIAPQWIDRVSLASGTVKVDLNREQVKAAPPFDSTKLLTRDDEIRIYKHYSQEPYWKTELPKLEAEML